MGYRVILVISALLIVNGIAAAKLSLPLKNIQLPPGFKIDLYSSDVLGNARGMCLSKGNNGNITIVYVSTREAKKVSYVSSHLFALSNFISYTHIKLLFCTIPLARRPATDSCAMATYKRGFRVW